MCGSEQCVELLLNRGCDPNSANVDGYTPLHAAAQKGQQACLKTFLQHGADAKAKTHEGDTALHLAAGGGHYSCAELLLGRKEVNIQARNRVGYTPLHSAVEAGHGDLVTLLLDNNAPPNLSDFSGATPLDIAERNENEKCVELLSDIGGKFSRRRKGVAKLMRRLFYCL